MEVTSYISMDGMLIGGASNIDVAVSALPADKERRCGESNR